jgi:hypothetical protein
VWSGWSVGRSVDGDDDGDGAAITFHSPLIRGNIVPHCIACQAGIAHRLRDDASWEVAVGRPAPE